MPLYSLKDIKREQNASMPLPHTFNIQICFLRKQCHAEIEGNCFVAKILPLKGAVLHLVQKASGNLCLGHDHTNEGIDQ